MCRNVLCQRYSKSFCQLFSTFQILLRKTQKCGWVFAYGWVLESTMRKICMSGIALDILFFLSRFLLFSSFFDDGRRVVIMSRGILLLILIIMLMIIIYPLERQLVHKSIVNTAGCHIPTCHARMHNSQRVFDEIAKNTLWMHIGSTVPPRARRQRYWSRWMHHFATYTETYTHSCSMFTFIGKFMAWMQSKAVLIATLSQVVSAFVDIGIIIEMTFKTFKVHRKSPEELWWKKEHTRQLFHISVSNVNFFRKLSSRSTEHHNRHEKKRATKYWQSCLRQHCIIIMQ